MTPETEVIACPACRHLVRVPLDWLGTQVQCPECKAMFRAPVRANGALTEPELLSRPVDAPAGPKPRGRMDPMMLIPSFGLLMCGVAGLLVNGWMMYTMYSDPAGAKGWATKQVEALKNVNIGTVDPAQQAAEDDKNATQLARLYSWLIPVAFGMSTITLLGGLALVLRRNSRVAKFGCVVAALNVAHGCCVPGAVAGLWGLLMMSSDEGREHFVR